MCLVQSADSGRQVLVRELRLEPLLEVSCEEFFHERPQVSRLRNDRQEDKIAIWWDTRCAGWRDGLCVICTLRTVGAWNS
jgi:hypothetical protein